MRVAMRGFAAASGALAQAAKAACRADAPRLSHPDCRIPTVASRLSHPDRRIPTVTPMDNGQGNGPLLAGLPVPAPTGILA